MLLVGIPADENLALFKYLASLRERFSDYGYEVVGLPCPVSSYPPLPGGYVSALGLYAISLMVNHRVLVSQYGHGLEGYDEQALEVFSSALPDYEVIPINCSVVANGGGAVNCTAIGIPDITNLGGTGTG